MIYLKRLIQRKSTKFLIGISVLFLLAAFLIFTALYDWLIQNKLYYTDSYLFALSGSERILSFSIFGRILLGLYLIKLALHDLPMWHHDAQNKDEFQVSVDGSFTDVRFKKWHWHVRSEDISASSFFFFDASHRFVSVAVGYQVNNALNYFFPEAVGKSTITDNNPLHYGSALNFNQVRIATQNEKDCFLTHTLKPNGGLVFKLFSAFLLLGSLGILQNLTKFHTLPQVSGIIFLFLLFFLPAVGLYSMGTSDKKEWKWIQTHPLYIADGISYAKRISDGENDTHYFIQVWDGSSTYLSQWFDIDKKVYTDKEIIDVTVYCYVNKENRECVKIIVKQ